MKFENWGIVAHEVIRVNVETEVICIILLFSAQERNASQEAPVLSNKLRW